MTDKTHLEAVAQEVVEAFEVYAPPVPIETMLQRPVNGMWEELDVSQLSGSFLSIKDRYSPRMSLARLLARHIASSAWGEAQGLDDVLTDKQLELAFARMLIMPEEMVMGLTAGARNPTAMSMHFEVPAEDAQLRLQELL